LVLVTRSRRASISSIGTAISITSGMSSPHFV
jgi:hypothetical protein